MVTPMFRDGSIDLEGTTRLAREFLSEPSVDGLFLLGATGEYMHLSADEKTRILRAAGGVERSGIIVANVGGTNMPEAVALARTAGEAGVDAIAAVVPGEIPPEPDAIREYFAPLGDLGLPVVIYWTPHVKTQKPTLAVVEALLRIPAFAGLKDSSRDMESFAAICAEFGTAISVFQGVEMLHLPSLACGSAGVIGGGLNLYPVLAARTTSAFASGDLPEAIRVQRLIAQNWELLNRHRSFRWTCKRIWAEREIIRGTWCREGSEVVLSEQEMSEIRNMVALGGSRG
jgi:4-hydroxy-tetrahydrodipicolinate synthase